MNIDKKFIMNQDGEDHWVMNVEGKPEIFGVIEKEYTKTKSKFVFSIKYYWKKVLQDTKYADTLEDAQEKLKDILNKVNREVKYVQSFESFINENSEK